MPENDAQDSMEQNNMRKFFVTVDGVARGFQQLLNSGNENVARNTVNIIDDGRAVDSSCKEML